jgi:hypothetical protein
MTRLILVALLTTACASMTSEVLGADSAGQETTMRKALSVISDRSVTPRDLGRSLEQIEGLVVTEPPEFWVHIVNDPRYSKAHRERCLVEFFRRHVFAGQPVDQLMKIEGVRRWFGTTTVFDMTMASSVPVSRNEGSIFLFQPRFAQSGSNRLGIFIRLSEPLSRDRLLALIHGDIQDPTVKIAEIGISEP